MKKNEPIILWRDEAQINDMRQRLENLLPLGEQMVRAYLKFPFANPEIDFHNVYANTEEQAKAYIRQNTPDTLNVAGLTLNKVKFSEFLELEGMNAFYDSKEAFRAAGGEGLVSYFTLTRQSRTSDDIHLEIDSAVYERYRDRYTISVRTEEDRKLYDLWQRWVETTQAFSDLMREKGFTVIGINGTQVYSSGFLRLDDQNRIKINPQAFQAVQKNIG